MTKECALNLVIFVAHPFNVLVVMFDPDSQALQELLLLSLNIKRPTREKLREVNHSSFIGADEKEAPGGGTGPPNFCIRRPAPQVVEAKLLYYTVYGMAYVNICIMLSFRRNERRK